MESSRETPQIDTPHRQQGVESNGVLQSSESGKVQALQSANSSNSSRSNLKRKSSDHLDEGVVDKKWRKHIPQEPLEEDAERIPRNRDIWPFPPELTLPVNCNVICSGEYCGICKMELHWSAEAHYAAKKHLKKFKRFMKKHIAEEKFRMNVIYCREGQRKKK